MGDKYGIFIDNELLRGYSSWTDTFDSPPLIENEKFTLKNIEIWGLMDDYDV